MSEELQSKIEEHREALETVANANCSASWIARELLESTEGYEPYESKKPTEPTMGQENEPQNPPEPKGSIFAY